MKFSERFKLKHYPRLWKIGCTLGRRTVVENDTVGVKNQFPRQIERKISDPWYTRVLGIADYESVAGFLKKKMADTIWPLKVDKNWKNTNPTNETRCLFKIYSYNYIFYESRNVHHTL